MAHPTELDLALEGGDQDSDDLRDHLRWCAACRRSAAEYGWLEDELSRALRLEAEEAELPAPAWDDVHRRVRRPVQRRSVGRRAAAVGLAAMVCLALLVPLVAVGGSQALAMTVRLEDVSTAPAPTLAPAGEREGTPASRACGRVQYAERISLPFVPPPTPPEPRA